MNYHVQVLSFCLYTAICRYRSRGPLMYSPPKMTTQRQLSVPTDLTLSQRSSQDSGTSRCAEIFKEISIMGDGSDLNVVPYKRETAHRSVLNYVTKK